MAVGDGTWVFPKHIGGNQPTDFVFTRKAAYGTAPDKVVAQLYQLCNSNVDHDNTGLAGELPPGKTAFMITDRLGSHIGSGKIIVKGHVERFEGSSVVFRDKSRIGPIDVVVMATGYQPEYPFFEKGILSGKFFKTETMKTETMNLNNVSVAITYFQVISQSRSRYLSTESYSTNKHDQ